MTKSKCFAPVRGRAMRATRLDGCGRPVYGDSNVAVSDGIVTISYSGNTTETDAIQVPNFTGRNCINVPSETNFSNYGIEIEFCGVDPALFSMLTGQEVIIDASTGVAIGFAVNSEVEAANSGFALEAWTGVYDAEGGCGEEGAEGQFGYFLNPYVQGGAFGDFTIENGAISFTLSGAQTRVGSPWGRGPYDVQMIAGVPAPLEVPVKSSDHLRVIVTTVAPPMDYCGTRPLLDPEDADLTGISATVDGADPYTYDISPQPAGTDPMWYDFGDGTWDYTQDGSISHTYDQDGQYTITGHRGSSTASTTVTVSGS